MSKLLISEGNPRGTLGLLLIYGLAILTCGFALLVILSEATGLLPGQPIHGLLQAKFAPAGEISMIGALYTQFVMILLWFLCFFLYCAKAFPKLADYPTVAPRWFYLVVVVNCVLQIVIFHRFVLVPDFVEAEDGLLETLTFAIELAASFVFLACIRLNGRKGGATGVTALLAAMAAVCFLVAMEEISWGQRIFGWESSEFFREYNVQDETNIHNLFNLNQHFLIVYQTLGTFAALVLVAFQNETVRHRFLAYLPDLERLLPSPTYFYFSIILILTPRYQELFEQTVAFFILCYAFDVLRTYKGEQPSLQQPREG